MNLSRVLAIVVKDLRDAVRDGRIVIALVLPIALAVFYNATIPEDDRPKSTVAIVAPDGPAFERALRSVAASGMRLRTVPARDAAAARRAVDADDVDLAVVLPRLPAAADRSSDAAVPRIDILLPDGAGATAKSVASLVPSAAELAAGRDPVADVRLVPVGDEDRASPIDVLDQRQVLVAMCILGLAGFVALMVVPISAAEEFETGTYGALRLAARTGEILLAKTLVGLLLGAVGVGLIVAITGLSPAHPVLFSAATGALILSMVGFGLLVGVLSQNANQINTFAGFLLLPVIGVGGAALFVDDGVPNSLLELVPFAQGSRLMVDGIIDEPVYRAGVGAWAVMAAWTVLGFALLLRIMRRREV